MGKDKLQELFEQLRNLKYRSDRWTFPVINENNFNDVETIIRQFFTENLAKENGEMQAKLYAYEKIIANSNFAPMIPQKAKELPKHPRQDELLEMTLKEIYQLGYKDGQEALSYHLELCKEEQEEE